MLTSVVPFRNYCAGLLLPGDRKSIEPDVLPWMYPL
jgi:hypothetical protein